MELRDIEIFLTLAEELHFGRTAERLHVSPARVSQAIKKQERGIGAELFERTSRQVVLTPVGMQLRDDLAPAYRQIQDAISRAATAGQSITGVLRVGFSAAWCGSLIVQAADAFRARHPGCEIEIQEVPLHNRVGLLRSRELDLQLTEFPVDEPDITNGPVIFSEPRAMVVPAGHPFAGRESVTWEDMAHSPIITIAGPPAYWLDYHLPSRTPAGTPVETGAATVAWQEVLSLVSAGKGVCTTAVRARDYYSRPDLVYVPFSDAPTVDFGLHWLAAGETVKLRAFVRTILDLTGDQG
ncbi:LysR family transcriptional regulator [Solihabitans fulvus]|uniref:LysR family transcriptional regulator n=1 Tax=Solihabitans fulvus TaxID=1892852 RepID=A0A5B2WRK8_9PSEU|nr:LysR family transcriptional regulator [Solihabitans fulvus]KAA2253618.1 LysR family transcriptional regulator [Solihabitans fulvus]